MRQGSRRQSPTARLAGPLATGILALLVIVALVYKQQQKIDSLNARIDQLESQVLDLQQRWYGTPALWQPPVSDVEVRYFDVKGASQAQLIDSLDHSDICKKYGPCAADPAVPKGVAWGLAGFEQTTSDVLCYAPSTTTFTFHYFVVIPRWSPPADGSVKIPLIQRWNALEMVVYTHEAGHVAIDKKDLADLNTKSQQLASCDAVGQFWSSPHVYDQLNADQDAYHARLHANCQPDVGCIPEHWMGW